MSINLNEAIEAAQDAIPVSEATVLAMERAILDETQYGLLPGSDEYQELCDMIEGIPITQSEIRNNLFTLLDQESRKRVHHDNPEPKPGDTPYLNPVFNAA